MSWLASHFNPLAPKRRGPSEVARIKTWVEEIGGIEVAAVIAVSELACREPGCPDLETVIGIFRLKAPTRSFRIPKPLAAVTREDVERAVAARSDEAEPPS